MNKDKLKQKLLELKREDTNASYEGFDTLLASHLAIDADTIDSDDLSHTNASAEVTNTLDDMYDEDLDDYRLLESITFEPTKTVRVGAVVQINSKKLVVAVAIPNFTYDGEEYIAISSKAPIYSKIKNKKAGDSFTINNKKYTIENVW